jgi:hypothetical protein
MKTFNLFFTLLLALVMIAPVSETMAKKNPNKQATKEMKRKD